ncbi:ferritin-like domain-containing protein [Corallococcus sp. Z5C101001]|uniref:ferritin-like domain-containing protein n=1 Tax=Corallococcus sp. Z5C101001 TaxID=2596829 RepID=UPI00117CAA97|nr:ferritin-like domain-containing protein [Corallococcus sp. Z5C101001]TSC34300.1 ferritin-like domain-containing protein [Corallococcus sp. Z5C101001]
MNRVRLRRLFSHALRTTLATPLLLAGCQGAPDEGAPAPDPGPVDLSQYSEVECANGAPVIAGLTIEPAPDVIQIRTLLEMGMPPGSGIQRRSSEGVECATATDLQACRDQLDSLTVFRGFPGICGNFMGGCDQDFMVTTRGNEVSAYTTAQAVATLLGHIDNPREAAILAYASGYALCGHPALEPGKVRALPDGTFSIISTHASDCDTKVGPTRYELSITASGALTETRRVAVTGPPPECVAIGRRSVGLQAADAGACEDARGHYFADAARLEAVSIHAFLRLREELALHGASQALQDAALTSALDEVRHAEVTTRLALRYGTTPPPPSVAPLPLRPLHEVLLDNTVEGCVRETYGALLAHHQALHARDPEVREAMVRIAEDETRHAALSWDIDAWAESRLSPGERSALQEARRQAVAVLRSEVAVPFDAELRVDAGLPSPEVAAALLDSLEQGLWA